MTMKDDIVRIFPNGIDKKPIELYFPDNGSKHDYFVKESLYCMKAYDKWLITGPKKERKENFQKLLDKRVEFAKSFGFVPEKGNKYRWIIDRSPIEKEIA